MFSSVNFPRLQANPFRSPTVLYEENTFVSRCTGWLRRYLNATAEADLKASHIKHFTLSSSAYLDAAEIAELDRMTRVAKLTIVEDWHNIYFGPSSSLGTLEAIEIQYSEEHKSLFERNDVKGGPKREAPLSWLKPWARSRFWARELKDFIFARAEVSVEMVIHGPVRRQLQIFGPPAGVATSRDFPDIDVLVAFAAAWSADRTKYVFHFKRAEADGRCI